MSFQESELRKAAAGTAGELGGRRAEGEYAKRWSVDDRRLERIAVGQRPRFERRDEKYGGDHRQRRHWVHHPLGREHRGERSHSVMVGVIESARVFDGIGCEVAMDEGLSRNRPVQVRGWQHRKRRHGDHRANRYADPEDSPFQQDTQYTGRFRSGVKLSLRPISVVGEILSHALAVDGRREHGMSTGRGVNDRVELAWRSQPLTMNRSGIDFFACAKGAGVLRRCGVPDGFTAVGGLACTRENTFCGEHPRPRACRSHARVRRPSCGSLIGYRS